MSAQYILFCIITALSMSLGQILFKIGASNWGGVNLREWVVSFLMNPHLLAAILLYAFTIILWIYVLRNCYLSWAYPLTALSYVFVQIFSVYLLGERFNFYSVFGSMVVILGVIISFFDKTQ
jgi:uncharacterized membrane protein